MRLFKHAYVRQWDRHGYVLDHTTHYAVVEWGTGEVEEVEQLDRSVEVVPGGDDTEDEIERLEAEMFDLEGTEAEAVHVEIRKARFRLEYDRDAREDRYRLWRISQAAPPTPEPGRMEQAA